MKSFHPPVRVLMGPGPSEVSARVLLAQARPTIGHLDPAFQALMEETKTGLGRLFNAPNHACIPLPGPGTSGMDGAGLGGRSHACSLAREGLAASIAPATTRAGPAQCGISPLFSAGWSRCSRAERALTRCKRRTRSSPVAHVPFPAPPHGCPTLAAPAGPVTATTLSIARAPRAIGPFTVDLDGYVLPGHTPSYAPVLLRADPGGALKLDFVVDPSVGGIVSNLHTHGLIVTPRPAKVAGAAGPCPAGDYVFLRNGPADAGGLGGNPPTQAYRIDIPRTLPASFLGRFDGSATAPYPAGLYWFHAHLHGVARPQVTEGMSGLISVGDDKDSIAQFDQGVRDRTDVSYLGLRDIQLQTAPLDCPGKTCPAPIAVEALPTGTAAIDAGSGYDPGLCAGGGGNGWCAAAVANAAGDQATPTYWMFTVNGQRDPTIAIEHGRNQLWRIANLSGTVSYVLKLCDASATCTNTGDGLHTMTVVSIDGVQTATHVDPVPGAAPTAAKQAKVGVDVDRLLLMPGSRAAIFVRNDGDAAAQTLQLRNESLNTGASGDTWPDMVLAEVTTEGPAPAAPGTTFALRATRPEPEAIIARVAQSASTSAGRDPATPDCSLLPRDGGGHFYRRQIIFAQDATTFSLGSQRVDQAGVLVADGRNIAPTPYQHGGTGGYTGDDFPPGMHVCATLGRDEVWELVNTTDEMHNFHIHQGQVPPRPRWRPRLSRRDRSVRRSDEPARGTLDAQARQERRHLARHAAGAAQEGQRLRPRVLVHPVPGSGAGRPLRLPLPHSRARGQRHDGGDGSIAGARGAWRAAADQRGGDDADADAPLSRLTPGRFVPCRRSPR